MRFTHTNSLVSVLRFLRTNLVSIYEEDLIDSQREQHVQEEDLITPNNSLLLRLLVQPAGPVVLDKLVLETILLRHVWDELL